jgi:vacuolar-type H+-ATPase catalytic subunit A/Vma1
MQAVCENKDTDATPRHEVLVAVVEALSSAGNQHIKVVRTACNIVLALAKRQNLKEFFIETNFLGYLKTFLEKARETVEEEESPQKREEKMKRIMEIEERARELATIAGTQQLPEDSP